MFGMHVGVLGVHVGVLCCALPSCWGACWRTVLCTEDEELKLEEVKASPSIPIRWSGGMGYLRRGK